MHEQFYKKQMHQQVSPEGLLNHFQSPSQLKFLFDSINNSKIKMSKKIYSLQTRNIKKFIKQQRQIQRNGKTQDSTLKKQLSKTNKKYDQNQLLQLQYKIKEDEQSPVFIQKSKTELSEQSQSSLKLRTKSKIMGKFNKFSKEKTDSINIKISPNRPKKFTQFQTNSFYKARHDQPEYLPKIFLRKKSKTFHPQQLNQKNTKSYFHNRQSSFQSAKKKMGLSQNNQSQLKKSTSSILKFESKTSSKNNLLSTQKPEQKLVQITDNKMIRYLKHIHQLVNGFYSYGNSLDQNKANNLLIQRYSVTKQINSENIIAKKEESYFKIPFMEFISQAETRKSIHRIINMPVKNTQRVVFKLLDFNQNGLIDQKDLIALIQLTQKIPEAKTDFLKLARYVCKDDNFSISNAKSISFRQESSRQLQKLNQVSYRYQSVQTSKHNVNNGKLAGLFKNSQRRERSMTHSTNQMSQFTSFRKNQKKQTNVVFNKQKWYSFLQTKNQFFKSVKKNKQKFKLAITLQDFHNIFGTQIPLIFYDIVHFLFNVNKQDLKNSVPKLNPEKSLENLRLNSKILNKNQGFKNYDIPQIVKDMQNRFTCNIQTTKFKDVLSIQKISGKQPND